MSNHEATTTKVIRREDFTQPANIPFTRQLETLTSRANFHFKLFLNHFSSPAYRLPVYLILWAILVSPSLLSKPFGLHLSRFAKAAV